MATESNAERWAPVPGYEGYYEVSSRGRVRSLARRVPNRHGTTTVRRGRVLKASSNPYPRVVLSADGVTVNRTVHSLVAEAFIGPAPGEVGRGPGQWQVNHRNGVHDDNRAENLEWSTGQGNIDHAVEHGLKARGVRVNTAKLTPDDVQAIRREHAEDRTSYSALGRRYGVSDVAIRSIVLRESWKHVE